MTLELMEESFQANYKGRGKEGKSNGKDKDKGKGIYGPYWYKGGKGFRANAPY